jgi:hypothetical protein
MAGKTKKQLLKKQFDYDFFPLPIAYVESKDS